MCGERLRQVLKATAHRHMDLNWAGFCGISQPRHLLRTDHLYRYYLEKIFMNKATHLQASNTPRTGWILYDGECSFCTAWVHLWEGVVAKRGFVLQDLQSAWVE